MTLSARLQIALRLGGQYRKRHAMANRGTPGKKPMRLVDPAAEIEGRHLPPAPRLRSLYGTRIGIIDNSKHMAGAFLEATKTLLMQRCEIKSFEVFRKFSASIATPPAVIERLTRSCDAVIHGVAD